MIVYLPDNSAFIYNLLTCPVVKYLTLSTDSYTKLSSDSMLTSGAATNAILSPPPVNGSIDYTPITFNCAVRVVVTSRILPCASIRDESGV